MNLILLQLQFSFIFERNIEDFRNKRRKRRSLVAISKRSCFPGKKFQTKTLFFLCSQKLAIFSHHIFNSDISEYSNNTRHSRMGKVG